MATADHTQVPLVDKFIRCIEAELEDQKLSISELARRAETARPYIHRVLSGKQIPTIDWCGRIADALGIEMRFQKKSPKRG